MATITLTSPVKKDKYTDYIQSTFDYNVEEKNVVNIPFNLRIERLGDWNIGLIVGPSGSGKSVILNQLGGAQEARFDNDKSVISNFDNLSPSDAATILCSVGLASVPTWVRPLNVLSNGERYRAQMAWLLAHTEKGETLRVDEYTSVVDRNVAKSMSYALQKYVRSQGKRIILAACHYDIIEWLQPDWIYDLGKGGALERGDCLQRRPQINLQIYRTTSDTWNIFKKHHYMSASLNSSAMCFVFTWDANVVGFASVLPLFGKGLDDSMRFHRVVVLPDFQGMGVGREIIETISAIFKSTGKRMYIKTVNPRIGEYFTRSSKWEMTAHNQEYRKELLTSDRRKFKAGQHQARASYCAKYIGDALEGFEDLVRPIDVMRKEKSLEGQLSLF